MQCKKRQASRFPGELRGWNIDPRRREGTGSAVLQSGRLGIRPDSFRISGIEWEANRETGLVSPCKAGLSECF